MLAVHQCCLTGTLLFLCVVGCDRSEPLSPESPAAAKASSGPTLNAPSGLNAVAASFDQINLSWQDNASTESGFEVHSSTTGPSGAFALVASTPANVSSYGNGGLTGSTQYCYKVRAFRTTGSKKSYSAFSNVACSTTPAPPTPAAPSAAHAAPVQGRWIRVNWTDNSSNESGFRLDRAPASAGPWTSIGTPSANATAFNDFSAFNYEETLCYLVVATNSYGDSPASSVFCTAVPTYPTNLAATVNSDGSADLTWTDNSAVEDGYQVFRNVGPADWTVIATLPTNATAYHETGLTPDNAYTYKVWATKDGGASDYSNAVQVVFAATPAAAPTGLGIQPTSSSGINGGWVDNSTNESGFRIERSTDDGLSWSTFLLTAINEYYFDDSGLASEQAVCYRVIAFNNLGESEPSNTDCTTPPAGPTELTVSAIDLLTVDLAWTDNSAVEDGYEVWVDDGYGSQYSIASLGPNTTTFRYDQSYDAYGYFVVAVKDGGYSDFSNLGYPPPPPGSSSVRVGSIPRAPAPRWPTGMRGVP